MSTIKKICSNKQQLHFKNIRSFKFIYNEPNDISVKHNMNDEFIKINFRNRGNSRYTEIMMF